MLIQLEPQTSNNVKQVIFFNTYDFIFICLGRANNIYLHTVWTSQRNNEKKNHADDHNTFLTQLWTSAYIMQTLYSYKH